MTTVALAVLVAVFGGGIGVLLCAIAFLFTPPVAWLDPARPLEDREDARVPPGLLYAAVGGDPVQPGRHGQERDVTTVYALPPAAVSRRPCRG